MNAKYIKDPIYDYAIEKILTENNKQKIMGSGVTLKLNSILSNSTNQDLREHKNSFRSVRGEFQSGSNYRTSSYKDSQNKA